ncbi:hypothetical protein K9M78_06395 [Candidatus Bipolaricaulota bacterium]|nr:hypothetical protein [Candidatus Bipolaricaulota bacterium]
MAKERSVIKLELFVGENAKTYGTPVDVELLSLINQVKEQRFLKRVYIEKTDPY